MDPLAHGTANDGHALQRLLDELGRLPGIGPKSAQRIAYYLLGADAEEGSTACARYSRRKTTGSLLSDLLFLRNA